MNNERRERGNLERGRRGGRARGTCGVVDVKKKLP